MFDKLKNIFKKPEPPPHPVVKEKKSRAPRKPKQVAPSSSALSEKEKATAAGEPYVNVISFDMNTTDIHSGSFELDWNDKFVLNLIRAGYKIKDTDTDVDVVDRWFTQVCRSIVLEQFEQVEADPVNRGADNVRPPVMKKNLGDGKVEIS